MKYDKTTLVEMENPDKFGVNVEGYSYTQLSSTWNVDNIFTYTRDFKNHHVDAMIGYTREASNSELLRTDFKGFSVPTTLGVYKQDLANTRTIRRERTSSSAIGILTRVITIIKVLTMRISRFAVMVIQPSLLVTSGVTSMVPLQLGC